MVKIIHYKIYIKYIQNVYKIYVKVMIKTNFDLLSSWLVGKKQAKK